MYCDEYKDEKDELCYERYYWHKTERNKQQISWMKNMRIWRIWRIWGYEDMLQTVSSLHHGSHLEIRHFFLSFLTSILPSALSVLEKTPNDYVEWKLVFDRPSLEAILCPHFHRNSPFVPLIIVKNAISCQSSDKCGNGSNIKVSAGLRRRADLWKHHRKTIDSCVDTERRRSWPPVCTIKPTQAQNSLICGCTETQNTGCESQLQWNSTVMLSSTSRWRCQPSLH